MPFEFMNSDESVATTSRIRGVCNWIRSNPQVVNINPYETIDLALDALAHPSDEAHTLMGEIWELRKGNMQPYLLADEGTSLYQMYETLIHAETAPAGVLENREFFKLAVYRNAYTRSAVTEGKDIIHINEHEWNELLQLRNKANSGDESTKNARLLNLADCMLEEVYQAMKTNSFQNKYPQFEDQNKL